MLKYELKKIFSKNSSKLALLILMGALAIACYLAIGSVYFVDAAGESIRGISAIRQLREVKNQWAGDITVEKLQAVVAENAKINASEEYLSKNIQEQNKAFGMKQGFMDIRDLITRAFCGFREYDYYRADSVSVEEVEKLYENRTLMLKEWLESEEQDEFSQEEKQFLMAKYEELDNPLYYEYSDGWQALIEYSVTIIMLGVLITAFLVSGIFSSEFHLKADSIFFSTELGRNKAVRSKILAGFLVVTGIYWIAILLYTVIVLGVLGVDGAECLIQTGLGGWKSFYNITYLQEYLLVILGGYLGSLLILTLAMFASARTRSTVLAVTIPFIILFLPSFLSDISVISKILGVLPDQLLQMNRVVKYFNLYQVWGKVVGAVPILLILYLVLYIVLLPLLYQVYSKAEVK